MSDYSVRTTTSGAGKEQRVHFAVDSADKVSIEQARAIQSKAGYDPKKHGTLNFRNLKGRTTWSCMGPEACK